MILVAAPTALPASTNTATSPLYPHLHLSPLLLQLHLCTTNTTKLTVP